MPACSRPGVYVPRQTHDCDAAVLVRRHLPGLLARLEEDGHGLPVFVKDELAGFGVCGDFQQGFIQTACRTCGDELRVPFSCKGRGFCPSCMGRRMAQGAALLVDHMLPAVGYRQWVLSFEGRAAVRLGYDQALLAEVAGALARAVMHDMRWAVKERHGLRSVEPLHAGVFMVVQRFRGDLGLFVHLHALATDGAFDEEGGAQRFLPAPTPTTERMATVLAQVHKVLAAVDEDDDLDMDPALRACVQLALAGPRLVPPPEPAASPPLTMSALGMHLHAATTVDGRDRKRLERVCRYLLRPPFAHDAVQALPDGRVRVHFKAPWRSGANHADMSADKFLARLCALVPPPGFHMTRYFGVFASRHHLRPRILPPSVVPASGQQLALGLDDDDSQGAAAEPSARPRRIGWANLLARVFAVDVTVCRKCGGRMHILDVVTDPDDITRILHGARAPPRPPRPHPPGQLLLLPT